MSRCPQPTLPFDRGTDAEPGERPDIEVIPTLAGSSQRALGAYYTPPIAAQLLVSWALDAEGHRVLEPSMGDGVFLQALELESSRRGISPTIFGVEIAGDTFEAVVSSGLMSRSNAFRDDFLAVKPFEVDAIVGNPPYVRLRHLPAAQARRAIRAAADVLGEQMDPAGSVWMPFVLHATRFLRKGGRLALVLPHDFTYVRYARRLWDYLGANFGELHLIRVRERIFPDILQEAVLLLAGGFGEATKDVEFEAYETVEQLAECRALVSRNVPIRDIVRGDRAFLQALLSDDARDLLNDKIEELTVPASALVTFNIGYVCGDKTFFHPGSSTIKQYRLPDRSLRPALTSSRQLRGAGLMTSALDVEARSQLFFPSSDSELTAGERRYVAAGEADGVSERYKCRIRSPWFVTPYVKVPDVVLPVFTERPALIMNDAQLVASNSLLCGYIKDSTPESLAASWFTSLTILQLELQVHALGGGVMVVVPREAGAVRLPLSVCAVPKHLSRLHRLLSDDKVEDAFASGDEPVLRKQLGLTTREVELIAGAAETLTRWRRPYRSSSAQSCEDIHKEQAALEGLDHPVDERGDV